MGKKKDWVEEIGNIELEISYTSGVYDLAFLMGYGWYEEVVKIVEQKCELYNGYHFYELGDNYEYRGDWVKKNLSKIRKEMML